MFSRFDRNQDDIITREEASRPGSMVNEYFDALKVEKEMLWLDIEKNRFAAYDFVGREPQKLVGWFDGHMA